MHVSLTFLLNQWLEWMENRMAYLLVAFCYVCLLASDTDITLLIIFSPAQFQKPFSFLSTFCSHTNKPTTRTKWAMLISLQGSLSETKCSSFLNPYVPLCFRLCNKILLRPLIFFYLQQEDPNNIRF
jgi:hypothetical protein